MVLSGCGTSGRLAFVVAVSRKKNFELVGISCDIFAYLINEYINK